MRLRALEIMLSAILATAIAVSSAGAQSVPPGDGAKRIVGLWRMVGMTAGGQVNPERGVHATGMLLYDTTGYMAVQIMPDRPRRKWAGPLPTPDEARDTVIGYSAYFGTYRVDVQAQTVTHIRAGGIEPGPLADQVRRFELIGDNKLI
jgi:hypothetical protein